MAQQQDFVQLIAIGRLTNDPELRYTNTGTAVASFRIACNRSEKAIRGDVKADFHGVVAWQKTAETAAQYLHKGDKVQIVARPVNRSYESNEGKTVHVTEYHIQPGGLTFLTPKHGDGTNAPASGAAAASGSAPAPTASKGSGGNSSQSGKPSYSDDPFADDSSVDISDDDLPF